MNIRLAEEKDIDSVIKLLTQVLNKTNSNKTNSNKKRQTGKERNHEQYYICNNRKL